jgi:hypothetical protein
LEGGDQEDEPDRDLVQHHHEQAIRRGTFVSVNHLITRTRDHVQHWNATAAPSVWAATADEILAKVRAVQTNVIPESHFHAGTAARREIGAVSGTVKLRV